MGGVVRQSDKDALWFVDYHCRQWAKWVNTDHLQGMGYPSETSERKTIYSASSDNSDRWGATPKTTRAAKLTLPDWKDELIMDAVIRSLNVEFRRVICCQHEVLLTAQDARDMRIPRSHLRQSEDGRYRWPAQRLKRIAATNLPERTFYRSLEGARFAVIADIRYAQI